MLHVGKKRQKTALYTVLAFLVLGVGFSSYAQLSSEAYVVRTVNIFPSEISADGWDNAETLTFQNLDEYALLQDFNTINSATLGSGFMRQPKVRSTTEGPTDTASPEDGQATSEAAETTDPSIATTTPETQASPESGSGQPETAPVESSTTTTGETITPDQTDAGETELETDGGSAQEGDPVVEETEETQEIQTGTTTVLQEVRSLFAFAIETLTETFSSTSATSSEVTEEQVEETKVPPLQEPVSFGFVTEEQTATTTPAETQPATTTEPTAVETTPTPEVATTSTEVVTPVAESSIATTSGSTTALVTEFVAPKSTASTTAVTTCGDQCTGYVLRLGNFGFPLEPGVEVTGAQLRMSMAAKHKQLRDTIPFLTMNYSFDNGESWSTGGSIVLDDEVSNSINGGYFLFALPDITDQAALNNLQVELRYDDDPALLSELFVESVWLELFVLEPPTEIITPSFAELLENDGFQDTNLSGDVLELSDTEYIEFTFTDDNEDETLIIKSDQKTYEGLSEATTYFSVTNTNAQSDDFSIQTYFPQGVGEVTNLEVFNLNKPRDVVVPEYRPYIYHCEAGWEVSTNVTEVPADILDLSMTIASTSVATATSTPIAVNIEVVEEPVEPPTQYSCSNSSLVRSCETIDGDGTACVVTQKVQDHSLKQYAPGWDKVEYETGELSKGGVLKRAASFFGFGPKRKSIPESFEGRVYANDTFSISPGETKYFKMDISFPPFSTGEYWIEAVGSREYGLLDPFWSSDWQYRMPFSIDNPTGTDQSEYQVRLQLDSAISDFWANVDADGNDLRFVQEVVTGNFSDADTAINNWLDFDFSHRIPLEVPARSVDADLTNFPISVSLSNQGAEFWSNVRADGGDIRVYTSDGTELAIDLAYFDATAEIGELHFLAPSIPAAAASTFYIYYGDSSRTGYAATDPLGSQAVWVEYNAVYHFSDDTTTVTNTVTDETGNGFDLVVTTDNLATTSGQYGLAVDLTGTTNGFLEVPGWTFPGGDPLVVTGSYFLSTFSNESLFQWGNGSGGGNQIEFRPWYNASNGLFYFGVTSGATYETLPQDETVWHGFGVLGSPVIGQDNVTFENGVEVDRVVQTVSNPFEIVTNFEVGRDGGGSWNGFVDELRVATTTRSEARVKAESLALETPEQLYNLQAIQVPANAASRSWYSTSWEGRQRITIPSTRVADDVTDFPVYLDLSVLGSDFFARVDATGSDIRITQGDGVTELPYELVSINTGSQTGELYFKTDLIDNAPNDFYIYFDNDDAIAYDRGDVFGSEAVWTNGFQAVYHFEEDASGIGNPNVYKDSTANQYDADDETSSNDTTGRFGGGVELGDAFTDHLSLPKDVLDGQTDNTVSWWHQTSVGTDQAILSGANSGQANEYWLRFDNGTLFRYYDSGAQDSFDLADTVGTYNDGTWQHHMIVADDAATDALYHYANGIRDSENPETGLVIDTIAIDNGGLIVGQDQDSVGGGFSDAENFDGLLDELRIAATVRSYGWAQTEYQNMSDPTTFLATSSAETLQATQFVELDYWLQYWDSTADEADIWVQIEDLPSTGAVIYAYYGNAGATAVSDEMATFSYDSLTEVMYVVDDHGADSVVVTSLVDNNQVQLGGGSVIDLNRGETTTILNPDGDDGLSVLGPVSAIVAGASTDSSDMLAPISFATTTFAVPTNRNTNVWYAYAPFGSTTVEVFEGASATPLATASGVNGTAATLNAAITVSNSGNDGDGAIIEATSPILLAHRVTNPGDGLVAYPPTTDAIYGINSNFMHMSAVNTSTDVTMTCSAGSGASITGLTRGDHEADASCTAGAEGSGSAVRLSAATGPISAIQQADSDGNETTVYWPEKEFGTRYALPRSGAYVAVVCAPRYGSVDLEMQDSLGNTIEAATCTPGVSTPGKAYFTNGTGSGDSANFTAGTMVVSTNGTPFYAIFEDVADDQDEKNIQTAVQARKFGGDDVTFVTTAQEEANGPVYEQLSYGWYDASTDLTPTSTWSGGGETLDEATAITGGGAVDNGDVLRLRMSAVVTNATATAGVEAYTLQYAAGLSGQCNAATAWNDVGQIGSTTAVFTGYNDPLLQDGTTLPSTLLASSTVAATYEERNFSDFIPTDIGVDEIGEWDWVIEANDVAVNTNYCFRMIRAEGQTFATYTLYPELETVGPPNTPNPVSFFDNENTSVLTPTLTFVATDIAGDDIHYEIEIDDDVTFGSVNLNRNSQDNFLQFENVNNLADKAPFTSGAEVRFTGTSDLSATTTYWWRVRASDPEGSATSSDWSTPFSFTTDTTVSVSQWLQTTAEQFSTNELASVSTSSGQVNLVGASGSMIGTPIDFDDATVGNAWGEVEWTTSTSAATTSIQVQYNNNGVWVAVPNELIPNNDVGNVGSPINILDLDTSTYNVIRLVANFTGGTASLQDWTVRWGQRVETPTLGDPFDNQKTPNTSPTFDFVSSDPQGDELEYELSFSTDFTFAGSSTTLNSLLDSGFASGADLTSPFASGNTVTYSGSSFTNGTTYWWRVRAKDPDGGNAWSPWSIPDSFTVDTSTTLSTWFQTTQAQFNQGELDGATASSSGAVVVSEDIGEYGSVTITNNNWQTVNTDISYRNMVVVASPEYDYNGTNNGRTVRVRNKTADSFEIKVDNYLNAFSGTTAVDYIVMEAGDWVIDDGVAGFRVIAGTQADVTEKQAENYSDGVGESIIISPAFGSAPAVAATVSSDNDSNWIGAHVDGGSYQGSVTTSLLRVALATSRFTTNPHSGAEDIDYVLFDVTTGTVNGSQFQARNTGDSVSSSDTAITLTGFSTTPAITVTHLNGDDGAQGGFAQKDTGGTNNATTLTMNVSEQGSNADGHTTTDASVIAFENASGIIKRDISSGSVTATIAGEDILFSDGAGPKFDNFSWLDSTPPSSSIVYQMQYQVSEGVYALIPDSTLPGNSTGFTGTSIDLTTIDINVYDQIRPFATLSCVSGVCPEIQEWQLEWSEGVNMSGIVREYDRSTVVTSGTVRAAVNNATTSGSAAIAGDGTWTLPNVTAFAGDVVTVWIDGAAEADEAVAAFVYDGIGDITGVELYEQHLSISADETGVVTNELLSAFAYNNSGNEDVFITVDAFNNLVVCGVGTCSEANIYIGPNNTYVPATTTAVTIDTHDVVNDGSIELDANTINVSGSWDNNATSSTDTSTVNMIAAAGTESIVSTEDPLTFHNLSFGGTGNATFTIATNLDLSGDFALATGTLQRDGFDFTVGGSITIGFGGELTGIGTTTFDGSGAHTWSDANVIPQNIGNVVIDGVSTIITASTDVAAYDIVIGSNDTLVGGTGNTIYVAGDWLNSGTFTANTSTVEIVNDDRTYPPIVPGSQDWYSDIEFNKRVPVVVDNTEVNALLTDFPLYVDLSTLGSEFWTGVQSDGRDIRVTAGDGQTELPIDVVEINTAAQTGELHFLANSVSSTVDTTFFVYFNNATATAYSASDTYGRNAVWVGYEAVYHFNDDPTSVANTVVDATGKGRDLLVNTEALATTTGQLGTAFDFTGSTGYLTDTDFFWTAGDNLITSGWYYMTAFSNESYWEWGNNAQPDNIEFRPWYNTFNGLHYFGQTSGATYAINPRDTSNWHYFTTIGEATSGNDNLVYEDAVEVERITQTVNNPENTLTGLKVGREGTAGSIDALMDEFRIATTTRAAQWVQAEYSNQFTPATFYATTSVETYQPDTVIDEATHDISPGGSAFYNLVFNDATTSPAFVDPSAVVGCDFTIATGTITLPTGKLNVGCSFLNNGIFMHNNGEVEFDGTGTETITLNGTQFLNAFYDVAFVGTGAWSFVDTNATTTNDLVISNGSVTYPSGALTIGGALTTSGAGAFDANTGLVTFTSIAGENLTTNGSSFNDVTFKTGGSPENWYDILWLDRIEVTIPSGTVSEDLTDFPVYVDLSTLGQTFWDAVTNDGRDIRMTQSDGSTEIPVELVSIDTSFEQGELYFRAGLLSATTDNTFYIYIGNGAATAYSESDTYGSQNVWSNGYSAVYHFENQGQAGRNNVGEYTDSTANNYDGEDDIEATGTTGRLGDGVEFDDANATTIDDTYDHINIPTAILEGTTEGTLSAWYQTENSSIDHAIVGGYGGENEFIAWIDNDTEVELYLDNTQENGNQVTIPSIADGAWRHYTFTRSGNTFDDEARYYLNGSLLYTDDNVDGVALSFATDGLNLGMELDGGAESTNATNQLLDGFLDEVRFADNPRTTGWITAEYDTQADPATFYSTSSQTITDLVNGFVLNETNTDVDGDLTINSAFLVAPSDTLTIGGSAFNNKGSFDPNNGTTTFDSTDTGETVAFGSGTFYNLSFNGIGGGWTIATNTVMNKATLVTGASFTQSPNTTLTVEGVFENSFVAAATTWTDSTLVLSGGDYIVTGRLDSGDDYANVEVSNDSDIVIWNSTIASSTINDTSSIYMPDYAATDGLLRIYGDYDQVGGTEYWSYTTDFDGTNISGTPRGVTVEIADASLVTIASTSAFSVNGTGGTTTIQSITGTYDMVLDGATVSMTGFSISSTSVNGLQLLNGAIVGTLSAGEFLIASGTTGVTVDAATIEAQPSTSYDNLRFASVSGTPANVTLSGVPAGYWLFSSAYGDRAGESFDNDDGDPGAIQWDDSSYNISVSGTVYEDDGVTPATAPVCNGVTNVVRVVIDGVTSYSAPCDPFDGSYTVTGITYVGNPKIITYIESSAANGAVIPGILDEITGNSQSNPMVLNAPAMIDGGVLVAIIGKDDDDTITPPAGWVEVDQLGNATGDQISSGIWYKVISDASSEPATYDFSSAGSEEYSYWLGSLVNVDTSSPLDVSSGWSKLDNDVTPNSPSVITTAANSLVFSPFYVDGDDDVGVTVADGWELRANNIVSSNNGNLSLVSQVRPSAGATPLASAYSITVGRDPQVGQFAFRAASAPTATSSITAAAVTQTPIGATGNSFNTITLRDEQTDANTVVGGGDIPVTVPTVVTGDVMVAIIGREDDFDVTPPNGWIMIDEQVDATENDTYAGAWYKIVTDAAAEPASYNFTNNDPGTEEYSYWIGSYSNVSLSNPIDVSTTWTKILNDTTPAASSITTVTDKTQLLAAWFVLAEADVDAPTNPWQVLVEDLQAGTSQRNLTVATRQQTTAGATGDVEISSVGGADDTVAIQIALRPSAISVADEIVDMDLYRDRVIVRHEDLVPLSIADMTLYDNSDDPDVPFTASTSSSPDLLTVIDGAGLFVWNDTSFAPGGELDLQGSGATAVDGSLRVGPGATYTANNTDPTTIGGSLYVDAAGTFAGATSTVAFTATNSGQQIGAAGSSTIMLYDVDFRGIGGGWAVQTPIIVDQTISAVAGIISGVSDITVQNGEFSGDGLVAMTGGTVQLNTTNTLGGTNPWSFYNLTHGDGVTGGVTTPATNATTTVANVLTIRAGHFYDLYGGTLDLAGSGNVLVETGTFLEGTSTVRYSGLTPNIFRTTYNNLVIDTNSGLSVTATAPTIGLQVLGDLTVGSIGTSTLALNTNDPLVAVGGDVYIGTLGTIDASASGIFDAFGNWDNDGVFVANGGLVEFIKAVGSATVAAGNSDFADVLVGGGANYTFVESATSTGNLTLNTTQFTLQSGETLAVGGAFSNAMSDSGTTWTGTTLRLYGGGAYTINDKTTSDVYDTIEVNTNTQPRVWNSDAAAVTTEAGSSLYSMDHADIAGDLRIYGDLIATNFTDHWSYETDFDGTVLGVPRQAVVAIESGGSVLYGGGALSIIGSTTASTTINAFGGGTYDFTVGGTTTVDFGQYVVRDTTIDGLVFTGSPTVIDLSAGDYEVAIAGGSAITVGGGVISANPAKNFTDNVFATTTAISAFNVTATGTSVSSWRFVNVSGNLDGEAKDNDPGGDPGYLVWSDSAAVITISGTVYSDEGVTPIGGTMCNGVWQAVTIVVAGLTSTTTSCAAGTGAYSVSGISYSPNDSIIAYLSPFGTELGATVTVDPISNIVDMDIYQDRVIVRNESGDPVTIADLAVWDSSDDINIPFTAVDAGTDTLTLPADKKLLVWTNKQFEPQGNITLTGGGAGSAYDGTFELYDGASFTAANGQSHSVNGSLIVGSGSTYTAAESSIDFTSTVLGRTIDLNEAALHDVTFSGSGSWVITDPTFTATNDVAITAGTVTLPTGTSTIAGSFTNSAGSFVANNGQLLFTATDAGNNIQFGGSAAHTVTFAGTGSWSFTDTNATTTDSFTVATGTVTLPAGTLTITEDFVVNDTIAHAGGTVRVVGTTGGNVVTLNGNDLTSLTIDALGGDYSLTDASAALLGDLTLATGTFAVGTGTVSISGSFDVSGGVYAHGSGTLLMNAATPGEFIDPGANDLYNLVIAGSGGWTLTDSATTTNNFSLTNAGTFTVSSGARVYVGGVFTNTVGGAATTWTGTTLVLDGANQYETNVKATSVEAYDTLVLGENTDISSWNSSASTVTVPSTSSWYSQDHAAADGDLYIYGDYHIGTTTEYWSATTDFDGASIGARQANIYVASSSVVTIDGGVLEIIGTAAASTSIQNQGAGTYQFIGSDGTLEADYYNVTDLSLAGLELSGSIDITSLDNGYFTQTADNADLINLVFGVINNNASLEITNTGFASGGFTGGVNVALDATTTNSWSFTGSLGNLWGEAFDVDGTDDCSSIRWDDSSCLLTEQTNYRWRNDDGGEGAPDSTWYDTDWSARQRIRVINDDAMAYASTAVKFAVAYDADMQTDFEDLRVTDSDGITLIPHWIEEFSTGVNATVWIQAPVLATSSVSEFYLYYGNVTATSTSDGGSVFAVIDDFEDNDISEYSGDTSLFNTGSTFAYGGGFGLDAAGNESARATDGIARDDITVQQGQNIRFMQYVDTTAGSGDEVCTLFGVQAPVTTNQNYAICFDQFGTDRISIVKDVENTEFTGTILASSTATFTTGWYEVLIDWQTNDTIGVTVFEESSGSVVATSSATDASYSSGGIGFTFWFQYGGWDSYVAWPRTKTVPTVFLGNEQVDGGATWANDQNTPTGGFVFGETARLRVAIENSGLPITGQRFQLEYAPKLTAPTCEAVSGGSFSAVPNVASCGSSAVCMATSPNVSDGDATSDHLVTAAGDFVAGAIVTSPNSRTGSYNLAQDRYTELEYAVQLTVNASNDAYCFRVTDDGASLDSYSNLPELTLAFDPVITNVTLNDGLDISLTPGATTTIIASSTVTDFNGISDFAFATTTFYKTSVGAACTPDDNNCYVATSSCSFVNCSGNSCSLQCTAPFAFHADATDTDGAEEWFAFMEVSDQGGSVDFDTSLGVELFTLRALDVLNAIGYGVVDINENTGAFNPAVSLVNQGNEPIDVTIGGTDMTDGLTSVIPAAQQLFSTSTFTYDSCIGCSTLSVIGANVEVDLPKPLSSSPAITDAIYWGIEVPFGTASAPHTGVNFFTAIAD